MNKLILENLSLLDKMHEGLIVISEKERTIQFASKPAIFLLKQKTTATQEPITTSKNADPIIGE